MRQSKRKYDVDGAAHKENKKKYWLKKDILWQQILKEDIKKENLNLKTDNKANDIELGKRDEESKNLKVILRRL